MVLRAFVYAGSSIVCRLDHEWSGPAVERIVRVLEHPMAADHGDRNSGRRDDVAQIGVEECACGALSSEVGSGRIGAVDRDGPLRGCKGEPCFARTDRVCRVGEPSEHVGA